VGASVCSRAAGESYSFSASPLGNAPVAAGGGELVEDFPDHLFTGFRQVLRGNRVKSGHFAADNAHGVDIGQLVRILAGTKDRRFRRRLLLAGPPLQVPAAQQHGILAQQDRGE